MSLEVERKFLLTAEPDWSALPPETISVIEFEQVYLRVAADGAEKRIRKRVVNGSTSYEFAELRPVGVGVRTVDEVAIDHAEYARLRSDRDPARQVVRKTRTTFPWRDRLYEVDRVREPRTRACWLLEVQVDHADDVVELPGFLPVDRDVTHEPAYRNAHIALG
ncbi:hypothetical protein SUDANB95_05835 [Actinosynnema sp. ALI-1.44]